MKRLRAALKRRERAKGDKGFVLVTFGLFLVSMMTIAALAIDVGAWYARGSQIQRAADAAALAGVVWMPDLTTATTVAAATATKNGFTSGVNNITVTVSAVSGNSRQLKVTITDANAPRYFSQFVTGAVSLTRSATAEYVMPLPLGSPKNTFGTGDILPSASGPENVWAAVNGYCAGSESGDNRSAKYDQILTGTGLACPSSNVNDDYNANGYYYTIDVAAGSSGSLNLWLFDPAYSEVNGTTSRPDLNIGYTNQQVTTTFKLYAPGPNAFEIPSGGALLKTVTYASGSTYKDIWTNFYNGTVAPGRYFLQVYSAAEQNSFAINGFGIQANLGSASPGNGAVGSGTGACTTIVGATGYSATCPRVSGIDAISIFNNLDSTTGTTATFYLSSVDPVYAGKTMDLQLFDPGEGALSMQVLNPVGTAVSFTWDTPCTGGIAAATGGCSGGPTTSLDVSGNGTQPASGNYNAYKYNDRMLNIHITLPSSFAAYNGKTWWQIKYTFNTAPNDRTTWTANISGNPVHLVQ